MSYNNNQDSASVYAHRTQFPDILSAPAPVLRDDDLLIDGETVMQVAPQPPSPAMSSLTGASPTSYAETATASPTSYETSRHSFAQQPQANTGYGGYSNSSPSSQDPYRASAPPAYNTNYRTSQSPASYSSRSINAGGSPAHMVLHEASPHHSTKASLSSTRPPEVKRMRQRRKVATVASGVAGGVLGMAVLGPVGAIAGGVGGAMLTKRTGKRMERKQTERMAAARYAREEARYGSTVPALQNGSSGLT